MSAKKGLVEFGAADLRVPLAVGDSVPCPNCRERHAVKRDSRPGTRLNLDTGVVDQVQNEALYVECPMTPGPIIVGMDGRALPQPLELTPRRRASQ